MGLGTFQPFSESQASFSVLMTGVFVDVADLWMIVRFWATGKLKKGTEGADVDGTGTKRPEVGLGVRSSCEH